MRLGRGRWLGRLRYPVRLLAQIAALAALVALLGGCESVAGLVGGGGSAAPAAKPQGAGGALGTVVSVVGVKRGPIASVLTYSGTLQPLAQVALTPRVAGRVEKVLVDVGSDVKAGDVLVELEKATLQAQLRQAEAGVAVAEVRLQTILSGSRSEEIASAEAGVASARAKLTLLQKGPTAADVQSAQSGVASAESSLQKAESDLAKLRNGPTAEELRAQQLEIEKQKTTLWQLQNDRDGTCRGLAPSFQCLSANARVSTQEAAVAQAENNLAKMKTPRAEDVASAERAVASARSALESAQAKLAQVRKGPNEEDVQVAEAALRQAESQLATRKLPYTSRDVDSAKAQVEQAKAAAEVARLQLAEATLVAPFDGVVLQKAVAPGAPVTQQTAAVTVGSRALEVLVNVDEGRLGEIEPGQPAVLKVPAYPDRDFEAMVAKVFPAGDAKSHNFTVRVTPKAQDERLRAGMFAEVRITTRQRDQATLLPKEALAEREGKSVVFVVADGRAALRPVRVGIRAAQEVEALEGVAAGESVVVAGGTALRDGDAVRVAGGGSAQPGQSGMGGPAGKPGGSGAPAGKPGGGSQPTKPDAATTPLPRQ